MVHWVNQGAFLVKGIQYMENSLLDELRESRRQIAALTAERQDLERLLQASDHERQLIAYEIHDGLVQYLAAALMHLQAYGHLKDSHPNKSIREYDAAMVKLQESHLEARQLINGVRSVILDDLGIVAAIETLVGEINHCGNPMVDFRAQIGFKRLQPALENAVYRIVQECLNNTRHHSKSDHVQIDLLQRGGFLQIEVQDWGIGFDLKKVKKGCFGVEGIQERARLLGGFATIESSLGFGTRVVVKLPIAPRRSSVKKKQRRSREKMAMF